MHQNRVSVWEVSWCIRSKFPASTHVHHSDVFMTLLTNMHADLPKEVERMIDQRVLRMHLIKLSHDHCSFNILRF